MKITYIAAAAALLVSVSSNAFAKDPTDGQSENIAVQTMICKQLYVHKPTADTNYQAGVDVNGKAVAPADLPGTTNFAAAPGDYIDVPLTVDLAKRLNQPVPDGVKMEGVMGNLRLYKDGRIVSNGQDISQQANVMCGNGAPASVPPASAPVAPAQQQGAATPPAPAQTQSFNAPAPANSPTVQSLGTVEVAPAPGSQQYYAATNVNSGATAPSATSTPTPPTPPAMASSMAAFPNKSAISPIAK